MHSISALSRFPGLPKGLPSSSLCKYLPARDAPIRCLHSSRVGGTTSRLVSSMWAVLVPTSVLNRAGGVHVSVYPSAIGVKSTTDCVGVPSRVT